MAKHLPAFSRRAPTGRVIRRTRQGGSSRQLIQRIVQNARARRSGNRPLTAKGARYDAGYDMEGAGAFDLGRAARPAGQRIYEAEMRGVAPSGDYLGPGTGNPIAGYIDASNGGIEGDLTRTKLMAQTVSDDSQETFINMTVALDDTDSSIVGENRIINQIGAQVSLVGDFGAGIANADEAIRDFVNGTSLEILVGLIPKATYSLRELIDTRFVQRGLDVPIRPRASNFSTLSFRLVRDTATALTPSGTALSTYGIKVYLDLKWIFDPKMVRGALNYTGR